MFYINTFTGLAFPIAIPKAPRKTRHVRDCYLGDASRNAKRGRPHKKIKRGYKLITPCTKRAALLTLDKPNLDEAYYFRKVAFGGSRGPRHKQWLTGKNWPRLPGLLEHLAGPVMVMVPHGVISGDLVVVLDRGDPFYDVS